MIGVVLIAIWVVGLAVALGIGLALWDISRD